jgi:hypothetical protein
LSDFEDALVVICAEKADLSVINLNPPSEMEEKDKRNRNVE